MTSRGRGDGGLYWDEARQRWVAEVTVGYDDRGKRVVRKRRFRSKTEAREALKQVLRDVQTGRALKVSRSVEEVVHDWLEYGLGRRSIATRAQVTILCERHIIPSLGPVPVANLKVPDVDRWLRSLSTVLSDDSLRRVHSCLRRALRRAMAQEILHRNVAELVDLPSGRPGRPSKSLTSDQVDQILVNTRPYAMHVACHEHGTGVAGFLPGSWDHLDCQSWDRPACLAGGSWVSPLDRRVGVTGTEVNGRGIQGGQCG